MVDILERDARMSKMLRDGLSTAQIAEALGVKEQTIIRRFNLLLGAGRLPPATSWGSGADMEESEARLIELVKASTPVPEICRIMDRSRSIIHARIKLLRDEGAFDNDATECKPPKADHDGFLELLREAHCEGAGERPGIAGRGHFARIFAPSPHSGVGSPALLCAGT